MRRRPRNPRTGMFTRPVVTLMVIGGIWSALVNLGLFAWARELRPQRRRGNDDDLRLAGLDPVL